MKGLSHKPVLHRTGQVMICAVIFRSRLHEMSKVVCTAHYMPEGDPPMEPLLGSRCRRFDRQSADGRDLWPMDRTRL